LHTVFAQQGQGGCVVTHEELRRVLDREVPKYTYLRAKRQHEAYCWKLGGIPCMAMVTWGGCLRQDCQFQHEKITVDWFNTRVRSVLMEIRILNLTGFHPMGVIMCVLPLSVSITDSDHIQTATGSASSTPFCIPRHQSWGPLQRSISGTRLKRWSGFGRCKNGSGRRATNSCSASQLHHSIISKPSFPALCPFARWRTTSTMSEHRCMSLVHGCTDTGSGLSASLDQG
jgi:hypothetical protein